MLFVGRYPYFNEDRRRGYEKASRSPSTKEGFGTSEPASTDSMRRGKKMKNRREKVISKLSGSTKKAIAEKGDFEKKIPKRILKAIEAKKGKEIKETLIKSVEVESHVLDGFIAPVCKGEFIVPDGFVLDKDGILIPLSGTEAQCNRVEIPCAEELPNPEIEPIDEELQSVIPELVPAEVIANVFEEEPIDYQDPLYVLPEVDTISDQILDWLEEGDMILEEEVYHEEDEIYDEQKVNEIERSIEEYADCLADPFDEVQPDAVCDCQNCTMCMMLDGTIVTRIFWSDSMEEKRRLLRLLRRFYERSHGFRRRMLKNFLDQFDNTAQADWDFLKFGELAKSMSDLAGSVNQATERVGPYVDSLNQRAEGFQEVCEKFTTTFAEIQRDGAKVDFGLKDLVNNLLDPSLKKGLTIFLFILIEILEHYFESKALRGLKWITVFYGIYQFIGTTVGNVMSSWIFSESQASFSDTLTVMVEGVAMVVYGLHIKTESLASIVSGLLNLGDKVSKIEEMIPRIIDWIKKFFVTCSNLVGIELNGWLDTNDKELKSIQAELANLTNLYIADPMNIGLDFSERISSLAMKVNHLVVDTKVHNPNSCLVNVLRGLQEKVNLLQRNASEAGVGVGERFEPGLILVAGSPGVGKTYFTEFLAQYLAINMTVMENLVDIVRTWRKLVYSWPIDDKNHDIYRGEPFTVFPDLFTKTDAEGTMSEANILIYLCGGQPVCLPAAELTKKQRLWFVSKAIIACTNVTYLPDGMFKSMRNADALRRRCNEFSWFQFVNPKYIERDHSGKPVVDPSTNKIKGYEDCMELYAKIDYSKIDKTKGTPDDIWFFRRLSFTTGRFVDACIYNQTDFFALSADFLEKKRKMGEDRRQELLNNGDALAKLRMSQLKGEAQSSIINPFIDKSFEKREEEALVKKRRPKPIKFKGMENQWEKKEIEEEDDECSDKGYDTCDNEAQADPSWEWSEYQSFKAQFIDEVSQSTMSNKRISLLRPDKIYSLKDSVITEEQYLKVRNLWDENVLKKLNPKSRAHLPHISGEEVCLGLRFMEELDKDPDLQVIASSFSYKYIRKFINLEYENLNSTALYWFYLSNIYDPVYAKILYFRELLVDVTWDIRSRVSNLISSIWHSPWMCKFMSYFFDYSAALISISILTHVITWFCTMFLWKKKKKKNQQQANWDDLNDYHKFIAGKSESFFLVYMNREDENGVIQNSHPCNAIALGEHLLLLVDHIIPPLKRIDKEFPERKLTISLVPFTGGGPTTAAYTYRFKDIILRENALLQSLDMRVIEVPSGPKFPRIEKLIPTKVCLDHMLKLKDVMGIFVHVPTAGLAPAGIMQQVPIRLNYSGEPGEYPRGLPTDPDYYESMVSTCCWKMEGQHSYYRTYPGECSSPGFLIDERKNYCVNYGWKQAQQPWLCYVHTSLQGGLPHGLPIYRELFQEYFDEMVTNVKHTPQMIDENLAMYKEEMDKLVDDHEGQGSVLETAIASDYLDPYHYKLCEIPVKLGAPFKSSIQRSPLYGIEPRERVPARLTNFRKGSEIIDVMKKARENYGSNTTALNENLMSRVISDTLSRIMSESSIPDRIDVLSTEQAIFGDCGYNLKGVDWSTSAGFYFRSMQEFYGEKWKYVKKAKRWMFDNSKNEVVPEVKRMLDSILKKCEIKLSRGERIGFVFIDNLKDELLKREKVAEGNTRLFCSADFIMNIIMRKYFGAFSGWMYRNRIRNGTAIGVNPFSREWDAIYTRLVSHAMDMIFGDYSKFDKRQLITLMRAALGLSHRYYDDYGSPSYWIREMLFEDIIDSIHAIPGNTINLYKWTHGNTSGNYLTAIINCVVNICTLHYAAVCAQLAFRGINFQTADINVKYDFNEIVRGMTYIVMGDDVVISILQSVTPYLDFHSFALFIERAVGMKFTDELKGTSGGEIPPYRKIEDGSFMGRKFRKGFYRGLPKIFASLRPYSIFEAVQWIKGVFDPEIEVAKVEMLLIESTQHGKEVFYLRTPIYVTACIKEYGRCPRFVEFDVALDAAMSFTQYRYSFEAWLDDDGHDELAIRYDQFQQCLLDWLLVRPKPMETEEFPAQIIIGNGARLIIDEDGSMDVNYLDSVCPTELIHEGPTTPLVLSEVSEEYKREVESHDSGYAASDSVLESSSASGDEEQKNSKISIELQSSSEETPMGGGPSDFDTRTTEVKTSTTTFMESNDTIESGRVTRNPTSLIEYLADIKSFLAKPYLMTSGTWTTAMAINTNLAGGTLGPLLLSTPIWEDKISGFNLIKGDFMIRVQLNANPMQQGKLLLHYLPCADAIQASSHSYIKSHNYDICQKVQHPHIELDCRKTAITMRIPYITPYQFYDLRTGLYDWGHWWLDIMSPLLVGPSVPTETGVEYSVFMWLENVELAAPSVPQSSMRETPFRRGGAEETKENQGPIASSLTKVSKAIGVFNEVPVIGKYARGAEWITGLAANSATFLGYSKPRELDGTSIFVQQGFRYAGTYDGPDLSVPGGMSCLNRLELIDHLSYTNEDEMSLSFLNQVPFYDGEVLWTASDGIGHSLFAANLDPSVFVNTYTETGTTGSVDFKTMAPFTYLASRFRNWRGSLKVCLKFVKTEMHSGRIMVTWTPVTNPSNVPDINTSAYSLRSVVDIRNEDTVVFELPFMQSRDYLPFGVSSGRLNIYVMNNLRAPATVAQAIAMQMFFSPGDDFEYQVPGEIPYMLPYQPQSDTYEIVIGSEEQGNNLITKEIIGGAKRDRDFSFNARRCIGERVLSIKTYLQRNCNLMGFTPSGVDLTNARDFQLKPSFVAAFSLSSVGVPTVGNIGGDNFNQLVPMYAFWRGGIRIGFTANQNGASNWNTMIRPLANTSAQGMIGTSVSIPPQFGYVNNASVTAALVPKYWQPPNFSDDGKKLIQHCPYYADTPFDFVIPSDGTLALNTPSYKTWLAVYASATIGATSALNSFGRSVMDDFQLGFFIGVPTMVYQYTA